MAKEIWKAIAGYEGFYEVSNLGQIRRVGHEPMRLNAHKSGYMCVGLCINGKEKKYRVHRLVATAFVPNPRNLPEVNHKDYNRWNNCADNLEWCDHLTNSRYSNNVEILQMQTDGTLVRTWSSSKEAERNGYHSGAVIACCKGKRKSHKGYLWRYARA